MKRVVISIVLATVFGGIPVFADSRDAAGQRLGAIATLANAPSPASPQFRRRYRRRRYLIVRRRRLRRRHMYMMRPRRRRMYVMRHRRRRYNHY
jgi:hypothetical protein